ncbi:MAG TPA: fluoride efflux transporter CrcB [Polyangiaceae bacterium]
MANLLWVCFAGALGSGTRYAVGLWASERFGSAFPYGTLFVNILGCFLIALVLQTALDRAAFPPALRLALATGFVGGMTTYSSFAYETVRLARAGQRAAALTNFGLTSVACFAAVVLGLLLAQLWSAPATEQP